MSTPDRSLEWLEQALGRVLQAGVLVSAACLAIGLIASMIGDATSATNAALTAGLMMLMATPILSVAVSLLVYVRLREWLFVATTVAVFVLLAITVALAWAKMQAGG